MTQENYTLKPTVDPAQEFIEIAYDFSNPLDLVREGISNGFDAGATEIEVLFSVVREWMSMNPRPYLSVIFSQKRAKT